MKTHALDELQDLNICAASCIHDLLNPLTALSLHIDLLSKNKTIRKEIQPLIQSSDQIRTFSKQISTFLKGTSTIETVDVHSLIQSTSLLLHTQFQEQNICFVIQSISPVQIKINPLIFQRIFLNILSNSIDAYTSVNRKKKQITITIDSNKTDVVISVLDNGCGMNDATLQKCSDLRFTTKKSGHGIGLWNVYRLVHDINGSIDIQSQEHVGTTLTVRVPMDTS